MLRDPLSSRSGSGGGSQGEVSGGRGGGAISIYCRTLNITGGRVTADGSRSLAPSLGSGSGGSIALLVSSSVVGSGGVLSAQGGAANSAQLIAAGGGGRIYFEVGMLSDERFW